jgi:4-hydroxybutyrate dehydrogenase
MEKFKIQTEIEKYNNFDEFIKLNPIEENDLIVTSEHLFNRFIKRDDVHVIFTKHYGEGEPTDVMIENIRKDMPKTTKRIIAFGGGTIIDIAKFLTIDMDGTITDVLMNNIEFKKVRTLYVIPTTCGTGSEVTNVAITELIELKTKKGLANDKIYPEKAVLISECVESLPYHFFATSSIDALIHAIESFLSPKASVMSKLFSKEAIHLILTNYRNVISVGKDNWNQYADEFLVASTYAGIAFGNAGTAAVHALSYPLGGTYHIPHGEANQLMFAVVFRKYKELNPSGRLQELEAILANELEVSKEEGLTSLYETMDAILERKPLREYGIKESDFPVFTQGVIEGQQRLLVNNYIELSYDQMMEIYQEIY